MYNKKNIMEKYYQNINGKRIYEEPPADGSAELSVTPPPIEPPVTPPPTEPPAELPVTPPLPDDCTKNNLRWEACNKKLKENVIGIWKDHLWNPGEVCHKCPMTDTRGQLLEDVENLP